MSEHDPLVFEFTRHDESDLRTSLSAVIASGGPNVLAAMRLRDLLDRVLEERERYERVRKLDDKLNDLLTTIEENVTAMPDVIGEIEIGGTLDDCESLRADEQKKIDEAIEKKCDAAKVRVREGAEHVLKLAREWRDLYKEVTE